VEHDDDKFLTKGPTTKAMVRHIQEK